MCKAVEKLIRFFSMIHDAVLWRVYFPYLYSLLPKLTKLKIFCSILKSLKTLNPWKNSCISTNIIQKVLKRVGASSVTRRISSKVFLNKKLITTFSEVDVLGHGWNIACFLKIRQTAQCVPFPNTIDFLWRELDINSVHGFCLSV